MIQRGQLYSYGGGRYKLITNSFELYGADKVFKIEHIGKSGLVIKNIKDRYDQSGIIYSIKGIRGEFSMNITKGQIYSYHYNPGEVVNSFGSGEGKQERISKLGTVFEITTIDGFIGITPIRDASGRFAIGEEYITDRDDMASGCYRLVWDPMMDNCEIIEEYGIDCKKCKKHYPDAVRRGDFECWGCRNGY